MSPCNLFYLVYVNFKKIKRFLYGHLRKVITSLIALF